MLLTGCISRYELCSAKVIFGEQYGHLIILTEPFKANEDNLFKAAHAPMFLYEKDRYRFRKALNPDDDLVVRAIAQGNWEIQSENAFAISLGRNPSARLATSEEWASSADVPQFYPLWEFTPEILAYVHDRKIANDAIEGQIYHYGEKSYAFSGQRFEYSPSMLSAGGEWLAIRSFNGLKDASFVNPGKRTFFVEIYSTESGKRIAAAEGLFKNTDSLTMLAHAGWVDDRYFLVPAANDMDEFLLFKFNPSAHKRVTP